MTNFNESAPSRSQSTTLSALPQVIEPTMDLWPGIERQIRASHTTQSHFERRPFTRLPYSVRFGAVAAITALLAGGVYLSLQHHPSVLSGSTQTDRAHETKETQAPLTPPPLRVAEVAYVEERTSLLKSLPSRLAALPPESRVEVLKDLKTVQTALESIQRALGQDTSNALLQELWINTCQDEMRLLTSVTPVPSAHDERL